MKFLRFALALGIALAAVTCSGPPTKSDNTLADSPSDTFYDTIFIQDITGRKWDITHAVDVYGRSPKGIPTAFEITLSTSNVASNALKTLAVSGGVQELIFLCPVRNDCKKVEDLLRKDTTLKPYLNQIQVCRIDKFIS